MTEQRPMFDKVENTRTKSLRKRLYALLERTSRVLLLSPHPFGPEARFAEVVVSAWRGAVVHRSIPFVAAVRVRVGGRRGLPAPYEDFEVGVFAPDERHAAETAKRAVNGMGTVTDCVVLPVSREDYEDAMKF